MESTDSRFEIREGRPGTGLGLYARTDIEKGDFVIEYTGKKIPNKIADDMTTKYLFELNDKWTIDAEDESNTARYINHGCMPSVEAEIEEGDDGEDHINIYALRDIHAGEELTIDYGEEYFDEFIKPYGCKCGALKHRS
ncbi:MAG TPA: SET domain-containing protein-lysine N-methyltransferase [Candidatus Paceibacterota bacterium]|nr:SET domain-containing protein-lysine N-methyltransferase [Candidatus Paceibacterota bacterium]